MNQNNNPLIPRLRSGYQLFQRPSPKSKFLATTLAAATLLVFPITLSAQTVAVDFGGDYATGNSTSGLIPSLTLANGDFDGQADGDDRRGFVAMGTNFPARPDNLGPDDETAANTSFKHGYQLTYFDFTGANPSTAVYRYFGNGNAQDSLQTGHGPVDASHPLTFTFAPYVEKANFLNGLNSASLITFANAAGSIVMDAIKQGGADFTYHAIVRNGANWYVSGTSSLAGTPLSINGATETWYPYNPGTNLLIPPTVSGGVPGSTLYDIQAVGMVCENILPAGTGANGSIFRPQGMSALLKELPAAVEFGGNYNDAVSNTDTSLFTLANGDFDGEADSDDRRGYIPMGTVFTNINDANGIGNNTLIYHGYQQTHLDSTTADPSVGIYRFQGNNTSVDFLQAGHGGTTAVTQQTFAPFVVKSDFLSGEDAVPSLAFQNFAGSVRVSLSQTTGTSTVNRAMVNNAGRWYVSTATTTDVTPLSINGFTEMWIPFDPNTNLYLSPVTLAGTPVAGSTFTNIVAYGAIIQQNGIASAQALNADRFSVSGFSAYLTSSSLPITVVNQNSLVVSDSAPGDLVLEGAPAIFSFDAGATAEKLIVSLGSETGGAGTPVISYNNVPLIPVPGTENGRVKGIWYLDAPFTGGAANLEVDMTSYDVVNGLSIGVVSVAGAASGYSVGNAAAGTAVGLTVPAADSLIVSAYASNTGNTPSVPLGHTQIFANNDGGSIDSASGFLNGVGAGSFSAIYSQGGGPSGNATCAVAFAPATGGGNDFADWIALFPEVGAADGLDDDADGDGNDNGVENFFGTNPAEFSGGMVVGSVTGGTFTFTHPQNATPAADLTASYVWSKDLTSFLASGATDGADTTVTFTTQPGTPSPGMTTVTATVTGTATGRLFVRVNVTQP